MSTISELEDALVEFVAQNTYEFRLVSNNESGETIEEKVAPKVWSGFIPRNTVGQIQPGEITTYPAIILNVRRGLQAVHEGWSSEMVEVELVIGTYDASNDQQGYRDVCIQVQRLKDRFREVDIIRERFPIRMPLKWEINRFYGGETASGYYPYFFGEMILTFELPVMTSQYDMDYMTGETTPGRYNNFPIPSVPEAQPKEGEDVH